MLLCYCVVVVVCTRFVQISHHLQAQKLPPPPGLQHLPDWITRCAINILNYSLLQNFLHLNNYLRYIWVLPSLYKGAE